MISLSKDDRYVIVGFGWVGQANALALKMLGGNVSYFDFAEPQKHYLNEYGQTYEALQKLASLTEVDSSSTWYFVCVGDKVSEDGTQDISSIRSALESLKGVTGKVVLRSTILPDFLEELPFDYYVPEFLHEQKAVEECLNPYFFVVGNKSGIIVEPTVFRFWRTTARKYFKGTPREASFIKYLSNIWNATRIAFVNEFGDAINVPKTKEDVEHIEKVIDFVLDGGPYLRYGRSFGGHCLPKDTRAFRTWCEARGKSTAFISGMYESNEIHSVFENIYPVMPEWYSQWPEARLSVRQAVHQLLLAVKRYFSNMYSVRYVVKKITHKNK